MVILICGSTHSGKTKLAQMLLEQYMYPYLSQDHLKMGLIRSSNTDISVNDDQKLKEYLWPITQEIIKTVIENGQNLIIEGCYLPFNIKEEFDKIYLRHIRIIPIVMEETYIRENFDRIKKYANVIEKRIDDNYLGLNMLIRENQKIKIQCIKYNLKYIKVDKKYDMHLFLNQAIKMIGK